MLRHRWRGACVAIALGLTLTGVASATAGPPTDRVREFFASANRIIVDPASDGRPDGRLAALRQLVTELVDFRNAAALALGPEWSARPASERDEFVRLFTDLLETSVFASVGARARIDGGITVTYIGEVKDHDATVVMTTLLTRSGRELSIGYRMALQQGGWVVHDVVVDGVSLVENYRAQFQKFMQRSSYAGLVSEMRTRIADLGRTEATASAASGQARVVAATPTIAVVPAIPTMAPAVPMSTIAAAAPPRHDVAPVVPTPAVALALPQPLLVAAVTPRESRPIEIRVPQIRELEPLRPAARVDRFWVQVGAFRLADKAMEVATALRDQTVSLFTAPNDPLLRVVVGPFGNREAATSKLREIRARGYDAFVSGPNP
jgi:phospholipid transport system substrate-binding protein